MHPGTAYKIQLSATPGTTVGLLAVDQSVYLLRNRGKLNKKRVRIKWCFVLHDNQTMNLKMVSTVKPWPSVHSVYEVLMSDNSNFSAFLLWCI